MTFYLKPPEGSIPTYLYQRYAECRLKYLISLSKSSEESPELKNSYWMHYSDCLIEGSSKDRVSHFALRSISILHPRLHNFVLETETLFFEQKLQEISYEQLRTFLRLIIKQLREYSSNGSVGDKMTLQDIYFLKTTGTIFRSILTKKLLKHVNSDCVCTHGKTYVLSVPFTLVPDLVAHRKVDLFDGQANLLCNQIPQYLSHTFKRLLQHSSDQMRKTDCMNNMVKDPRFLELSGAVKRIFETNCYSLSSPGSLNKLTNVIRLEMLDDKAKFFPPCMKALHKTLRSRHRLCHRPRVQYTLFLKDIGMPLEEFLQLIQSEYSQPRVVNDEGPTHKCEHSWQQDSRRFIYGTRHLYGLEGARKTYLSHTCSSIQAATPAPNECGGCPFKHYDQTNFRRFLTEDLQSSTHADEFRCYMKNSKVETPIESCHLFFRYKSKHMILNTADSQKCAEDTTMQVNISSLSKPKHFYAAMSDLVK